MGFFSNILKRKEAAPKAGGMGDYMMLISVYFEASLASNLGINNLGMLPELRTFKTTLHVPTLNNKLGLGERKQCEKMMREIYGTNDNFFREVDASIRKNCRKLQDVQPYMAQFQAFCQDLMMLIGNLMKLKPWIFQNYVKLLFLHLMISINVNVLFAKKFTKSLRIFGLKNFVLIQKKKNNYKIF